MPAMAPPKPEGANPFGEMPQINPYASPPGVPQFPASGVRSHAQVKDYMVQAILCLIFCGGVFAIPAIVYAADVKSRLRRGDYAGAVRASQNAKKWCLIAVCIGLFCGIASIALQVLVVMNDL